MVDDDDLEDRVYAEQERLIARRFGDDAAASANYGWFVDDGAEVLRVETKVYVEGRPVLVSTAGRDTGEIAHGWRD